MVWINTKPTKKNSKHKAHEGKSSQSARSEAHKVSNAVGITMALYQGFHPFNPTYFFAIAAKK